MFSFNVSGEIKIDEHLKRQIITRRQSLGLTAIFIILTHVTVELNCVNPFTCPQDSPK